MTRIKLAIMAAVLVLFTLAGTLTGCDRLRESIKPTIDREGQPISVQIYFYGTPQQVTHKYREIHGISPDDVVALRDGFAIWPEWRDTETGNSIELAEEFDCEVHTARPTHVDDQATLILGHEILHCVYGLYHR